MDPASARRLGVPHDRYVPLVKGEQVRDWLIIEDEVSLFPYAPETATAVAPSATREAQYYWMYRTLLRDRQDFGEKIEQRGLQWFEHSMFFPSRVLKPLGIAFAFVATHNHFVLERGGRVFNRSAPVIKLPSGASEDEHLALLAYLNSSTACFWIKQVMQPKGATATNRNHPDVERAAYEVSATALLELPIPPLERHRNRLVELARVCDASARRRRDLLLNAISHDGTRSDASTVVCERERRWVAADRAREEAVFAQEEIDWIIYELFGLAGAGESAATVERVPRGERAFECLRGRRSFVRESGNEVPISEAQVETSKVSLSQEYLRVREKKMEIIGTNALVAMLETYEFKRHWRDTEDNVRESDYRKMHDERQLRQAAVDSIEKLCASLRELGTAKSLLTAIEHQSFGESASQDPSAKADLLRRVLVEESVPYLHAHVYTESGLEKHALWEVCWERQRREDQNVETHVDIPPQFSQGSRGKEKDFQGC